MFNETFEEDLKQYAQTQCHELFSNRLYEPLSQLFKWICSKQASNLSFADFEDIQQQVIIYVMKKIKYFKIDKGVTAVSFVRMLMAQELHYRKKQLTKNLCAEYKEDEDTRIFFEPKTDALETYKERLEKYRLTIPVRNRKVITVLIASITDNNVNRLNYADKISYFARKANVSKYVVLKIIRDIKRQQFFKDVEY